MGQDRPENPLTISSLRTLVIQEALCYNHSTLRQEKGSERRLDESAKPACRGQLLRLELA